MSGRVPPAFPLTLSILLAMALLVAPGRTGVAVADGTGQTCVELLNDGGFEAGGQGWEEFSLTGNKLVDEFYPRTGQLGAYLAGGNNADDRMTQALTLPAGATSITLSAWWAVESRETVAGFDELQAVLLGSDGAPLAELASLATDRPAGVWDEVTVDLTSYAGRSVRLQFAALTDDSNTTDFYVDDASLRACVGGAGAGWRQTYLPQAGR